MPAGGTVSEGQSSLDTSMLLGDAVPAALTLGDKVTGDVVLVSGDMQGVARAIGRSRAVMRNIRQNLIWAFGDNIALIPVAMGALVPFGGPALSPMLGAMAASSIFVLDNALRLRR